MSPKSISMMCRECGNPARLEERQVDVSADLGVRGVWIENMRVRVCSQGHVSFLFSDFQQLEHQMVLMIIQKPAPIRGDEVRFLRKATDRRALKVAGLLGITPQHMSKLENSDGPVPTQIDHAMRLLTCALLQARVDMPDCVKTLEALDANQVSDCAYHFRLTESDGGWRWQAHYALSPSSVRVSVFEDWIFSLDTRSYPSHAGELFSGWGQENATAKLATFSELKRWLTGITEEPNPVPKVEDKHQEATVLIEERVH